MYYLLFYLIFDFDQNFLFLRTIEDDGSIGIGLWDHWLNYRNNNTRVV